MPAVSLVQVPEEGSLGVSADDVRFVRGDRRFALSLGTLDSVNQQTRTLTLFDRGKTPVPFSVTTSAPWLEVSEHEGSVEPKGVAQVRVSVDWGKLQGDAAEGTVTVRSGDGRPMLYTIAARSLPVTRANAQGFVESDGYVAIEAADTTARRSDGATQWVELPGYGETRSAMTVVPGNAASEIQSQTELEYRMYLYDSGNFDLQMTLSPTLNFVPGRGLRFGVSVDDGPRMMVDALEHDTQKDWAQAVSDGVRRVTVPLQIAAAGYHTVHVWAVDPAVVVERLVLSHGDLRASYLGPPESFHDRDVGAGGDVIRAGADAAATAEQGATR
jgi:hypothetical protein